MEPLTGLWNITIKQGCSYSLPNVMYFDTNNNPINFTGAVATLIVTGSQNSKSEVFHTFTSNDGNNNITLNGLSGVFSLQWTPAQSLLLPIRSVWYCLTVLLSNGINNPLLVGQWNVIY